MLLRVSSSLKSFFFQNFATKTAKTTHGLYLTIMNMFCAFLISEGFNGTFFEHNFYVNVLKISKRIINLVFENISKCSENCCFGTMNYAITCIKIVYMNFKLTI